ncbi:MAG: 1-(5-phosphoribosyl)-5-[(5-phosphoribosylamino)methylideneamino]imidazole-4-carboxamide isomerase [Bacteroidaceae bacterium]|nr:1-(5-phosphoribosyl)-5-[(5-phosphoribosylamino)methylideneamino]imidazole-4-carboxamide isomerase [Bacteroidaceae bacterium]
MMELIPAIDLIDGRCVRLTQGDYGQTKIYDAEPVDMARRYADCGVRRLHIVDLDGAKAKAPCNLSTLEKVVAATGLDVEWGGGIKDSVAMQQVVDAGASRVICGSVAVDNPELFAQWLQEYGASRVILGADIRDGRVATHGWLKDGGMGVEELVEKFLPYNLSQLICTDISRDGMLQGPNLPLYEQLQQRFPMVDVTLSGGVSSMDDLKRARECGVRAAIIGKAIYEGRITLKELERWLLNE